MKILVFLIGFPMGIAIIYYRKQIVDFTGQFEFAENIFGMGGTYTMMLFLGFLTSFMSITYGFGFMDDFLSGTILKLFLSN